MVNLLTIIGGLLGFGAGTAATNGHWDVFGVSITLALLCAYGAYRFAKAEQSRG